MVLKLFFNSFFFKKIAIFSLFQFYFILFPHFSFFSINRFFVLLQLILGETILSDLLGIIIGHVYFFLVDIYPNLPLSKDHKILDPPPAKL